MKKNFKSYAIIWAVLLALFNVVVFFVRPAILRYGVIYSAGFWIAWVFIIASFVANLLCASKAFKAENLEKLFYKIPLITVSYTGLIVMLILGGALMLIPNCPVWIAAVVCAVVAAFTAISVVKANWAGDAVDEVHEKVKTQTQFIKLLTVDAESMLARAKSDAVKTECKKVYESVRYSDPMSNDALSVIEAKITVKMDELSAAVSADDAAKAKEIADELVILVGDRNRKCKALK